MHNAMGRLISLFRMDSQVLFYVHLSHLSLRIQEAGLQTYAHDRQESAETFPLRLKA